VATVDVTATFDDKEVRKWLSEVSSKLKKSKDAHKDYVILLSAIVYKDIIDHFDKEMGPDGKWKKWSRLYSEMMTKRGKSGNKILQDTVNLRQRVGPIERGGNFRKAKDGILWFNNAKTKKDFPYAFAHDNDTESRKTLPRRSFMWLSDKALESISKQTLEFLMSEK
jgi:hypothetical protein